MKNSNNQKIWIAEVVLIVSTAFTTWLMACADTVHQYSLGLLFKCIIIALDISVFLAIILNFNFAGGLAIFYFWRIMTIIFAQDYSLIKNLWPICVHYGMYKLFSQGLVKVAKIQFVNSKDLAYRAANQIAEQKRRILTLIALSIAINLGIVHLISIEYHYCGSILFLINFSFAIAQIYIMRNADNYIFKIIVNLMPYNLSFFIVLSFALPKIFLNNWLVFARPAFIHLFVLLILLRISIGSYSNKFDHSDRELFNLAYVYNGSEAHKLYKYLTRDNRLVKLMDQLSRLIGTYLYYLGFLIAIHERSYAYFVIGIFMTNFYAVQDNSDRNVIGRLLSKFRFNLHLNSKIILPLFALWYILIFRVQISQKQLVYYNIHSCLQSTSFQQIFTIILACLTIISQLIPINIRLKVHLIVKISAPLYLIFSILKLQCQNIDLALMGFYCLALCFTIIRDEKLSLLKGAKQQ